MDQEEVEQEVGSRTEAWLGRETLVGTPWQQKEQAW